MELDEKQDINIENWSNFLRDNDEIMKSLNFWASDVCDIIANVNGIKKQVDDLNSSFSSITTLDEIPTISPPNDLMSNVDDYSDLLSKKI
jgi:hypothetical protein